MKPGFLRLEALAAILVIAGSLTAQTPTGSVSGTVSDPSGAPVAGSTVRIINDATHETHTTTTGNAGVVLDWFEEWLQTEWTDLDVFCTSLTEEFANATLVGPRSREVLAALAPSLDLTSFPFMALRETDLAGIPARIFRISF